jgi:hypothetical protein
MGIANDYTPNVDDLTAPTIAHAAFRMADEVRLLKARAKDLSTNQQDGKRVSYRVKATELLDKNTPVRVAGYDTAVDMVLVAKANTSTLAIGVTSDMISQSSSGLITHAGVLEGIDTTAWAEGATLYVGDNGTYLTASPATGYAQPIAYVIKQDAVNGAVLVNNTQVVFDELDTRLVKATIDLETLSKSVDALNLGLVADDIKTVRYSVTALAGQTAITVPLGGFKIAEVYINGVHQDPFTGSYTISNSTFTLSKALAAGDSVYFILGVGYDVESNSNVSYEVYTASDSQTQFKLTYTPIMEETLLFVNGVKQAQNSYQINLDTIVLTTGLVAGDLVEVVRINRIQAATQYQDPITLSKNIIQDSVLIPSGYNARSVGPTIGFAPTAVVTIQDGAVWTII